MIYESLKYKAVQIIWRYFNFLQGKLSFEILQL